MYGLSRGAFRVAPYLHMQPCNAFIFACMNMYAHAFLSFHVYAAQCTPAVWGYAAAHEACRLQVPDPEEAVKAVQHQRYTQRRQEERHRKAERHGEA